MTTELTPSQTVGPFLHIGLPWPDGPFVVPEGTPGSIEITALCSVTTVMASVLSATSAAIATRLCILSQLVGAPIRITLRISATAVREKKSSPGPKISTSASAVVVKTCATR